MEAHESIHPEVLEEKAPAFIASSFQQAKDFLSFYGWYGLGATVILIYLWSKFLEPAFRAWRQKRDDEEYAARYHKNPDVFRSRQEAMEAARLKAQAEYDIQSKIQAEKARQREELKREEWLSRQVGSTGSGQRLGGEERQGDHSNKKSFKPRPEYNPLMGAGGSGGYRPPKRGCPGGGCGKK